MQNRPFATPTTSPAPKAPITKPVVAQDQLVRIFNTAIVSTQAGKKRDFSAEIYELTESSSFKTILSAVRQLARVQGVSERQAAEEVIQTFRKMDEIWSEYVFKEGLDKLRNPRR
jgi:hypothetical protein